MMGSKAIAAIKKVRDTYGISLKEARDLWDTYQDEAAMCERMASAGRVDLPRPTYAQLEAEVIRLRAQVELLVAERINNGPVA